MIVSVPSEKLSQDYCSFSVFSHKQGSQSKPENGTCILIDGNKSDGSEPRSQEGSQDEDINPSMSFNHSYRPCVISSILGLNHAF